MNFTIAMIFFFAIITLVVGAVIGINELVCASRPSLRVQGERTRYLVASFVSGLLALIISSFLFI